MMKHQKDTAYEVEERWDEFWRDHRDYDSPWARGILHDVIEFLPYVFDFDAVKDGVTLMYRESGVELPSEMDPALGLNWTSADEELPVKALDGLPIFQLALAIRAYAYYGLDTRRSSDFRTDRGLSEFLEDLDGKSFPVLEFDRDTEMTEAIRAALARRKLDEPERGPIKPEELAALARVSRKSIMNLLAPNSRGPLRPDADGAISVESARSWLLSRRDFRQTLQSDRSKAFSSPPDVEDSVITEPVFVPVAGDGTWFSPGDCSVRKGSDTVQYHVSNGGHEEVFECYWSALDFLSRAESPRWRYSDAGGRRRIKNGVGWARKKRSQIME